MASTPYISHTVNGYSRYEIPESVAFSASAGILYPVRCDFMNARDVRYIQTGAVIRTNPALVPTFTPFRVSLHRFFVPMQLYHPEMRVNSSKFDFQTLSTNCVAIGEVYTSGPADTPETPVAEETERFANGRSLTAFLGLFMGRRYNVGYGSGAEQWSRMPFYETDTEQALDYWGLLHVNADPVLAYYDIIRSYYAFSQLDTISLAFPMSQETVNTAWSIATPGTTVDSTAPQSAIAGGGPLFLEVGQAGQYWRQAIGRLEPFDELFESTFYPKRGETRGLYYDRTADINEACYASLLATAPAHTPQQIQNIWSNIFVTRNYKADDATDTLQHEIPIKYTFAHNLPFGVAPAVADRFSRLLPAGDSIDVSIQGVQTVRGLAFAAKLQAYKDLLSSGGNRFTDWLMTFFAAKVKHVDRPILVYSSSFYMNSSPIFSQQGGDALGTYAGVIQGQDSFGKNAQRYSFDEPGYLMDIFCVRPLYYWSGIQKDYARYDKMDYFNPVFNEVGYETLPATAFGGNTSALGSIAIVKQPCYNEFRASYDRVLGDLALTPGRVYTSYPTLASWVQQRRIFYQSTADGVADFRKYLDSVYFTDVNQANSVFASTAEDNFFVNLYYRVSSKSLVSKNFATNLATR